MATDSLPAANATQLKDSKKAVDATADMPLSLKGAIHPSMFEDGAIPANWLTPELKYTYEGSSHDNKNPLEGMWELLLKVSEPCDDILSALGLGVMQRSLLRCYKSRVEIRVIKSGNDFVPEPNSDNCPDKEHGGHEKAVDGGLSAIEQNNNSTTRSKPDEPQVLFHVKQYFPMHTVKEIRLPESGSLKHTESDTMQTWTVWSLYHNGILYQKRESELGVMYDVRCLFNSHPDPSVASMLKENVQPPLQLLRITFIDPQGRRFVANRWFQRADNSS